MLGIIGTVIGIIAGMIGVVPVAAQAIKTVGLRNPIKRLYDALGKGHSITTKSEIEYQIRCYVPQRFRHNGNEILSTKELIKNIRKISGDHFFIIGKPASGKTVAMRYLYSKLVRTEKCIYLHMKNVRDAEDLNAYLSEQKGVNKFKEWDKVIVFIDGADEAIPFWKAMKWELENGGEPSQRVKFEQMFLRGTQSELYKMFLDKQLIIDGMVFGLRPEFFDKASSDFINLKRENINVKVFELLKMSEKDIVKVFKSLKILRKIEKRKGDTRRHQFRYPKPGEERKYINLFRKILKSNPDSVFYYPMYVRYAYAFMKEYETQWNPYMSDLTPESDLAAAFDVLVNAILKWEFHIYYGGSVSEKDRQWEEFHKVMDQCMDNVIKEMMKSDTQELSREQMEAILKDCVLNAESQARTELVLAHCFMVTDDKGEKFEFCHYSIYEYFFAKYLFYNASFEMRKTYLLSDKTTENLQHMYYMIFCRQKSLNEKFSKSIADCNRDPLTLGKCLELQRQEVIEIVDDPAVTLVEIYEYLPFAYKFLYRGNVFTQEQLDQIITTGDMDLTQTGWDRMEYAGALVSPVYVSGLNLCGLPLKDIRFLKCYKQLKWLDLRIKGLDSEYTEQTIEALDSLSLTKLMILTENGAICERIDSLLKDESLSIGEILVETSDYSEAYPKLYQMKKQAEETGQKCSFHVMRRTGLKAAKQEFKKKNNKKNSDILEAVFELEADESTLGFAKKDAEATFWTGLALVDYYIDTDNIDEDGRAYKICTRIEPFIPIEDKEVNVNFGKIYGELLLTKKENQKALQDLTEVYRYSENYFSEEVVIEVAVNLQKAQMRCNKEGLDIFMEGLENQIKKLPNYQENWGYLLYLGRRFMWKISQWKQGEEGPENIDEDYRHFQEAAEYYAEQKKSYTYLFNAYYYAALMANRKEETQKAAQMLSKLEELMEQMKENHNERIKQGNWIKYHEQKLYYLVLADRYKEAVTVADELMEYPYRPADKMMDKYKYIRDNCILEEGSQEQDFDRHRLWDNIWY